MSEDNPKFAKGGFIPRRVHWDRQPGEGLMPLYTTVRSAEKLNEGLAKRLEAQLAERDAQFAEFIKALELAGLSVYQMPDGDWAYAVLGTISDRYPSAYAAIFQGVRYAIQEAQRRT